MNRTKYLLLILFPFCAFSGFCQDANVDTEVKNLATFARLYGYVKYFYPGDEAAKLDWTKFEMYAIPRVEKAKTPDELVAVLDSVFLPFAPGLQIYDNTHPTIFNKSSLPPPNIDTSRMKVISWQHLGLGLSDKSIYKDFRINRDGASKDQFGSFMTCLNGDSFQGKEFKFRAAVKIETGDKLSKGHLWFRVDKADMKPGFFDNMNDRPIVTNEWKYYEISGKVDDFAKDICFGIMLWGTGKMWVDDVELLIKNSKGEWVNTKKIEGDFEDVEQDKLASPWVVPSTAKKIYDVRASTETAMKGKKSILITNRTGIFDRRTHIGDYIQKDIGNGLGCIMPLAVYGDPEHTYPQPDKQNYYMLMGVLENEISDKYDANNKKVMLADVIKIWNVYQHFYVYFDRINLDWQKSLEDMLRDAYADKNEDDFTNTLKKYISLTRDGHGIVGTPERKGKYFPSFRVEYIEKELVITSVFDSSLSVKPGDIIVSINGTSAKEYFDSLQTYTTGATKGYRYFNALSREFEKDSNTKAHFVVRNAQGEEKPIDITFNYPLRKFEFSVNETRYKKIGDGRYYINLNNIHDSTLDSLLPSLSKAKSIIFDMRGYPDVTDKFIRHLLTREDTFNHWFQIPEIIYPDRDKMTYEHIGWDLMPDTPHIGGKIIYIIDGRAVSAAESYTELIKGYKLATVIGQPTAGTNGNVNYARLAGDYYFYFTGMKVVKMDGSPLFGVGILPDIYVEKTIKGVREGRDEFLEKAIELAKE